jgi:hypothetical protein
MSKWHQSRTHRLWRAKVIRRDKCCVICGSMKSRTAHHLNHGTYFPDERADVDNGVTLCRSHHTIFHCSYKNSFRTKCTKKQFLNFLELLEKVEKLRLTKKMKSL